MAHESDPIVYRYKPVHDGDGFPGVPRRDLRQSDVDALQGAALRHVTVPDVAEPIYVGVGDRREAQKQAAKERAERPIDQPAPEMATVATNEPSGDAAQKGGD